MIHHDYTHMELLEVRIFTDLWPQDLTIYLSVKNYNLLKDYEGAIVGDIVTLSTQCQDTKYV